MSLLQDCVQLLRGDGPIRQAARQIAQQCEDRVWQRVEQLAATMGQAEARGYIRARSALVLAPAVQAHPARHDARLMALATDYTLERISRQLVLHRQSRDVLRRAA